MRMNLEPSTIALIIVGATLVLYVADILPIALTSIIACLALAVFGVIPLTSAFAGFSNDIVFMIAGMMVVGAALFETGAADVIGKKIVSAVGTNERVFIAALMLFSIPFSAFLSNTATASIMLPIAASAIGASGGRLTKKNTYMPIGIACVAGGGLTLVSSTPQLIAQGLLRDGGYQTMSFFEIGYTGFPVLALLIVYCMTIGFSLQRKVFGFPEVADEFPAIPANGADAGKSPEKSVLKMFISIGALVFCIIGFLAGLWTLGIVSMAGAAICVATGCISQKRVFQSMDWTTVILMGCSFGVAAGLEQSGAGTLIARGIITLMGDGISPWLLFSALALIAVLLTNFISSTATGAILIPIAIFAAADLGFDVKSAAIAVSVAANIGYATPISTPPLTMTLTGGYRFMDYVKVGGLFNLLAYVLVVILFRFVLKT